jgi:hypothetical protein
MVLIVPCAGKSTRFNLSKPKYLLTHPDGKLMIEKSLEGMMLDQFDRIIITIVSDKVTGLDAELILSQVFDLSEVSKYELCVLPNYTSSQSETVFQTLLNLKISSSFSVKDSDNKVKLEERLNKDQNYVLGLSIKNFEKDINRLQSKSFIKINDQNIITNIVEKSIISDYICVGLYVFSEPQSFIEAFEILKASSNKEIYPSHIIAHQILNKSKIYSFIKTTYFEDYGTLEDWTIVQSKMKTYFVDYDGVLVINKGKYGNNNWNTEDVPIERNLEKLYNLSIDGAQIIITTARPDDYKESIIKLLDAHSIKVHSVVCGLNHSQRLIINDFANTNPYPSAIGISMIRNGNLDDYI